MTDRQLQILIALIEIYAKTAEPVSSELISRQFENSPATIRAEMVELERQGYIVQPHTSAGRVPTDKGYRTYVNALEGTTQVERMSHAIARRVASAGDVDRAIITATDSLVSATHNLGLATLSDRLYLSGLSNLFGQPEFYGGSAAYEVARLLDDLDQWLKEANLSKPVNVYIGHENPIGKASGASLIISRFESPYSDHSYIGILGPTRQSYGRVIGLVGYAGELLQEVLNA
jgi:heat-inducible transcriptional repressor